MIGLKNISLCHLIRSNTTTNCDYLLYTFPYSVPATSILFECKLCTGLLTCSFPQSDYFGLIIWLFDTHLKTKCCTLYLRAWNSSYPTIFCYSYLTLWKENYSRILVPMFFLLLLLIYTWPLSLEMTLREIIISQSVHGRICTKIKMGAADWDFILVQCHWQKSGICAKLKQI